MGLEDDTVGRHRTRRRLGVGQSGHDGAAAAGLVAHDDRVAGGDRGVPVARVPEHRLEQPGRLGSGPPAAAGRAVRRPRSAPAGRASDRGARTANRARRRGHRPRRPAATAAGPGATGCRRGRRHGVHPRAPRPGACTAPATRRPWRAAGRASTRAAGGGRRGARAPGAPGPRRAVVRPSRRRASRAAPPNAARDPATEVASKVVVTGGAPCLDVVEQGQGELEAVTLELPAGVQGRPGERRGHEERDAVRGR